MPAPYAAADEATSHGPMGNDNDPEVPEFRASWLKALVFGWIGCREHHNLHVFRAQATKPPCSLGYDAAARRLCHFTGQVMEAIGRAVESNSIRLLRLMPRLEVKPGTPCWRTGVELTWIT